MPHTTSQRHDNATDYKKRQTIKSTLGPRDCAMDQQMVPCIIISGARVIPLSNKSSDETIEHQTKPWTFITGNEKTDTAADHHVYGSLNHTTESQNKHWTIRRRCTSLHYVMNHQTTQRPMILPLGRTNRATNHKTNPWITKLRHGPLEHDMDH